MGAGGAPRRSAEAVRAETGGAVGDGHAMRRGASTAVAAASLVVKRRDPDVCEVLSLPARFVENLRSREHDSNILGSDDLDVTGVPWCVVRTADSLGSQRA